MKKILSLVLVPNISFAGGSGIAHINPGFWILLLIVAFAILGLVVYFIYCLLSIGKTPSRNKWYQDRNKITDALTENEFQMIFSDMESGVILYKNKDQNIEINKCQNQWFIKAEKQKLQIKGVFKAFNSVEDLNESLLMFIQ